MILWTGSNTSNLSNYTLTLTGLEKSDALCFYWVVNCSVTINDASLFFLDLNANSTHVVLVICPFNCTQNISPCLDTQNSSRVTVKNVSKLNDGMEIESSKNNCCQRKNKFPPTCNRGDVVTRSMRFDCLDSMLPSSSQFTLDLPSLTSNYLPPTSV